MVARQAVREGRGRASLLQDGPGLRRQGAGNLRAQLLQLLLVQRVDAGRRVRTAIAQARRQEVREVLRRGIPARASAP
jgi:hypothetical protein